MSRNEISDDAILEAVREAFESDDVDRLGGGVRPEAIHDELESTLSLRQLQKRLQMLAEAGHLDRVSGIDPETSRPRWSFRPVLSESG